MPETTHTANSQIEAIAGRFWRLDSIERGAMVLCALGGQRRRDGWMMPNGRVFDHRLTAYQATDLNAIAGAEHAACLMGRRSPPRNTGHAPATHGAAIAHTVSRKGGAYVVEIRAPEAALLIRVEARREATARALAVVLLASALRMQLDHIDIRTNEPHGGPASATPKKGGRRRTLTLAPSPGPARAADDRSN